MRSLTGIPASPGIALGPAFILEERKLSVPRSTGKDAEQEWQRLQPALDEARRQLETIRTHAAEKTSAEDAAIFEAHALFLSDPSLLEMVKEKLRTQGLNAEAAWQDAIQSYAAQLEAMEDELFRARSMDVRDVGQRVLRLLMGVEESSLSALEHPSIVLARDLTPSDTVRLEKKLVLAFVTAEGGPTSHTAILAKALCLPAVVGAGEELLEAEAGENLIVDGTHGEVILNPDAETVEKWEQRRRTFQTQAEAERKSAQQPGQTRDGERVEVVANIGNVDEAAAALEFGAEGIGLLRTEFLYLERDQAPNEEEQFEAYHAILETMGDRPVVVRTLDIGGDKHLPYLDLGHETNPFMGWRAIRMCLDRPDFFKIQLRALLRAGPGHDLRIMFPMIATLEEVRRAKALLEQAREELIAAGAKPAQNYQVGIMVEIPSVAVLADQFAREVDFFSIGTNDLTQYTMAAERTNEKVAYLGDACHPAVLRQIDRVLAAAHEAGIWVGLCGELAGDPDAIPILLGLGLDEFSMAPSSIPHAKAVLSQWSHRGAQSLAEQALDLDAASAVRALVRDALPR